MVRCEKTRRNWLSRRPLLPPVLLCHLMFGSAAGVVKQMYDGCLPPGRSSFVASTAPVKCPCFVSFSLWNFDRRPDATVDCLVVRAHDYEAWSKRGKTGDLNFLTQVSRTSASARDFDPSANNGKGAFTFSGLEHEIKETGEFVVVFRATASKKDCSTKIGYVFERIPEPCPERLNRMAVAPSAATLLALDQHFQTAVAAREKENKIVAGTKASDFEDRSYLAIVRSPGKGECSGSIISSSWILTAAHCAGRADRGDISVYVAGSNTRDGSKHVASRVVVHPKYKVSSNVAAYDLALVRLENPIEEGTFSAVALNSNVVGPSPKTFVRASGYGSVSEAWIGGTLRNLHRVDLPVVANRDCLEALGEDASDLDGKLHLCAGHQSDGCMGDTCLGDSGGPVVVRGEGGFVQVAVTAGGVGCARDGKPGVYTRVGGVLDWIEEVAGESGYVKGVAEGRDPTILEAKKRPSNERRGGIPTGVVVGAALGSFVLLGAVAALVAALLFHRRWNSEGVDNKSVEEGTKEARLKTNSESTVSTSTTTSTDTTASYASEDVVTTDFFGRRAEGMLGIMR